MKKKTVLEMIDEVNNLINFCSPEYDTKHTDKVFIAELKHVVRNVGGCGEEVAKFHRVISHLLNLVITLEAASNKKTLQHANEALAREGFFTPENAYQIKEDLETISQLHERYKIETRRFIEEAQLTLKRNSSLQIEVLTLKMEIAELRAEKCV